MKRPNLGKRLFDIVRDPAVATLLGVISILSAIAIAYITFPSPPPRKDNTLRLFPESSQELTDLLSRVGSQTKVLIDGKEQKNLRLNVYLFDYDGEQPLRPSDFAEPLVGKLPAGRRIVAIQKSSDQKGPLRFTSDSVEFEPSPPLNFEAKSPDPQTCQISPLLMNPHEWFRVEVYTSSQDSATESPQAQGKTKLEEQARVSLYGDITWSCRIAGVVCSADRLPRYTPSRLEIPDFLRADSSLSGWAVYFVVMFNALNLLLIGMLMRAVSQKPSTIKYAMIIAVAATTSIVFSDGLTLWISEGENPLTQPNIARLFYVIHILLLAWLVYRAKRKKRRPPSDD